MVRSTTRNDIDHLNNTFPMHLLEKDDDCCNKELRGAKKAVSFSICNGALSISENKSCVSHSEEKLHQQKMKTSTSDTAKSSADDIFVCKKNLSDEHIDCEKSQCQYIRQITQLKKRRKGMIKMGSFMNEILTEAITSADNEIDELRDRREAAHAVKGSSICLKPCRKEKSEKTFKDKSVATKISEDIKEFTNTVVENLEDKKYSTVKDIQLTSSSKSEQNGSKRSSIESNSKNLERIPIVANRSPSRINSLLEEKDSDELLLSSLFEARNKFAARKKRNSFEGNIQGKSNTNSLRGISEAIDFDQKNLSEKVNDKHEKIDQHKAEGVKNDVLCSESDKSDKSDKQEDAYGGSSSSAASKVEDFDTQHKIPELGQKISLHPAKFEETLGEDIRPLMSTEKNDQKEFEETAFETNKKEQNKESEPDTLNKNVHVGEASHKTPENTGNENSPHFQRCTCGRNPVSKIES
ncbi:hypothetical protein HHI36_008531 [Cryptolaemus montrouzieri]|uniref:Shugoshin C-terminal domain-containing protein n=1 Tax=Cryptolaemus montrouzieri TaxID=559131 RepID=A0ABD2MT26_9CUCU